MVDIDKKFLDDYVDAAKRGFQLQVKSLGQWISIEYREDKVYVGSTLDIINKDKIEYYLHTPIGKFYKNTIRIDFYGRSDILKEE